MDSARDFPADKILLFSCIALVSRVAYSYFFGSKGSSSKGGADVITLKKEKNDLIEKLKEKNLKVIELENEKKGFMEMLNEKNLKVFDLEKEREALLTKVREGLCKGNQDNFILEQSREIEKLRRENNELGTQVSIARLTIRVCTEKSTPGPIKNLLG